MSVILTACRHSKQRAIETALKKKAEKQKQKRLAEQQFACDYPEPLVDLALSRMWSFEMYGSVYTVVLVLESGREIVDIYCNDEELSYVTDIQDGSIRFDFLIDGSHKARISCRRHSEGLQHTLIVEGEEVPEIE